MTGPHLTTPESPSAETLAPAEHADQREHAGGFLLHPFVQNMLPFITSLSVHVGLLILVLMAFGAYQLVEKSRIQEQLIIADSPFLDGPSGLPLPTSLSDVSHPPAQNMEAAETSASERSFSEKTSPSVELAGEATILGPGPTTLGPGRPGSSGPSGPMPTIGVLLGTGDGRGPFGRPGHTTAHQIVFLCDATGSMINKMATLKDELNKTVVGLRPSQSFDIIFYQGTQVEPMAPGLVAATPQNRRKAGLWLEEKSAHDTTDPIPSLVYALKLKPEILYFLTDAADFPDPQALLDAIKKYNPENKTKINTILFVENKEERMKNADSEGLMKKIASESSAMFKWVEMDGIEE